jgi:hypothetical protein
MLATVARASDICLLLINSIAERVLTKAETYASEFSQPLRTEQPNVSSEFENLFFAVTDFEPHPQPKCHEFTFWGSSDLIFSIVNSTHSVFYLSLGTGTSLSSITTD